VRATFLAFTVLVSVVQITAQQASTVPPISRTLQDMKSRAWTERSQAFDKATELLGPGQLSPSDSDRLKVGIIQLLIYENAQSNVPDSELLKKSARRASGRHDDEIQGEEYPLPFLRLERTSPLQCSAWPLTLRGT
jgi:hypothetical protein